MRRRALGRSGLELSVLGLGGWQIGGPGGPFAWPEQDKAVSIAAIHAALDAGFDWIDTAPVYGLGRSEEVVGRAVAGLAERPLVFTKCSLVWDESGRIRSDLGPDSVRQQLHASLRRLGLDAIDLYQIHWPAPAAELELAWATLAELKREGLVRALGASNFSVAELERVRAVAPVDALQPPYSLLDRRFEDELLAYCREHGIGVLAYSPLQSGILSGTLTRERLAALPSDDWRHRDPQFREPHVSEYLAVVDFLRGLAARHGVGPAEVALAWALRDPVVTGAIVGVSRPDQVAPIARAGDVELRAAEVVAIERCLAETVVSPRPPDRFTPPGEQPQVA